MICLPHYEHICWIEVITQKCWICFRFYKGFIIFIQLHRSHFLSRKHRRSFELGVDPMSCIIHLCNLQNFSWIHTSWKKSCKLNVKKSSTNFTKPWTLWWTLLKMKKNSNKSPCLKLTLQIIICKPKAVDIRPQFGFADYA